MRDRNQRNLLDTKKLEELSFVVIGAGAIGSFFVMTLAKMGAKKITVYDFDSIEEHNISNQMYPLDFIEMKKTDALQIVARNFGGCEIEVRGKWTPEDAVDAEVIVSAVDNMDVRKELWGHYNTHCNLFLDGRMSAMVYKVYAVDTDSTVASDFYETTLYPQSEAAQERCGEKSIIFTVLGVAGTMLNVLKQWIMNEHRPTEIVADMYNHTLTKKYHMEEQYETTTVEDTETAVNA